MAFEERIPTEEEKSFLESFGIRCQYGSKGSLDEIYHDKERNFYMFYLLGSGYKKESLPMYWGIVWNNKPMILGVYKESTGRPSQGLHIVWEFQSLVGLNDEFISINEDIIKIIKEALKSTKGYTTCKVISTEFKF